MIRVVTLNNDRRGIDNPVYLGALTEQLRLAEIDILCCQGMQRTLDGGQDPATRIAESLQMTSIFSATDCSTRTTSEGKRATTVSGLSILSGVYIWMLHSGSFPLPGEDPKKKQVAQYAVVRQNEDWMLVINAEFSPVAAIQLQQLRAVFSHPRLQERYGAVILCSNRNLTVSKRDLQSITALSAYKLANETITTVYGDDCAGFVPPAANQKSSTGPAMKGVIFTFIARNLAPVTLKIHVASASFLLDSILTPEVAKQEPVADMNKFFFPLSYSEQWPGTRQQDQILEVSTS